MEFQKFGVQCEDGQCRFHTCKKCKALKSDIALNKKNTYNSRKTAMIRVYFPEPGGPKVLIFDD